MGKGQLHVDFFTACPHEMARNRAPHWRRRRDLWFSLSRSLLAAQHSSCRVQCQSRCGIGNMTLDYWCGSWDGGGERGARGLGNAARHQKPCFSARTAASSVTRSSSLHWCWCWLWKCPHLGLAQASSPGKKRMSQRHICLCGEVGPDRSCSSVTGLWAPLAADQGVCLICISVYHL